MSKKPVVIYGASGYTGRLIAEYLREYQIPFIAAGRNASRIEAAMAKVPGIETADYEIVEVEHTVEAVTHLLEGTQVVCNSVGPFAKYADEVLQAALNAGVHYMDTTGEQAYMLDVKKKYGQAYADKRLTLTPATAYMFATMDIAANLVMEQEEIHTLECSSLVAGIPTEGSTQTIFHMLSSPHYRLENNEFAEWPRAKGYEVAFPGRLQTVLAHPWGGGSLPLWFEDSPQIRNVTQLTAFTDREMFEHIIEMQKNYEENIRPLPVEEQQAELAKIADSMTPGMPPRENQLIHKTLDVAIGTGTAGRRTCVLRTGPAYLQTGVYQAAAVSKLLKKGPEKIGFCSPCEAYGYKYLLGAIKNFFPTEVEVY